MNNKKKTLVFGVCFVSLIIGCSNKNLNLNLIQQDSIASAETPFRVSLKTLGTIHRNMALYLKYDSSLKIKSYKKECNELNVQPYEFCKKDDNVSKVWSPVRYFFVDNIENKTASTKLNTLEISNFFKTALNNIGSDYKLIENSSNQHGDYKILGAITGYDIIYTDDTTINGKSYGGKGQGEFDTDADYQKNIEYAEITLDLLVSKYYISYNRWMFIPNVTASNKLILKKDEKNGGFSLSILGAGFSYNKNLSIGNHLHYATRLLAEKSLLEILAKLDDYTYWGLYPDKKIAIGDKVSISNSNKIAIISKIDNKQVELIEDNKKYILPLKYLSSLKKIIPRDKSWEREMKNLYKNTSHDYKLSVVKGLFSNIYSDINKSVDEEIVLRKVKEYKKDYSDEFYADINNHIDENLIISLMYHVPRIMMSFEKKGGGY